MTCQETISGAHIVSYVKGFRVRVLKSLLTHALLFFQTLASVPKSLYLNIYLTQTCFLWCSYTSDRVSPKDGRPVGISERIHFVIILHWRFPLCSQHEGRRQLWNLRSVKQQQIGRSEIKISNVPWLWSETLVNASCICELHLCTLNHLSWNVRGFPICQAQLYMWGMDQNLNYVNL